MGQDYDKILKENIESIFLPLAEKFFGIKIVKSQKLQAKLQTTLEREPDFLRKVLTGRNEEYILQIEFQTADEKNMVLRMAEYKGILQRMYELPVKQFAVYLGANTPKMRTKLTRDEIIDGFELTNVHDIDAKKIDSDIPEEVMLSILGNYPKEKSEAIIAKVIEKLQ